MKTYFTSFCLPIIVIYLANGYFLKGQCIITTMQTAGSSLLLSKPFSSPPTALCDKIYLNFVASHLIQQSAKHFFLFSWLSSNSFLSQSSAWDLVDEIHKSVRSFVIKALVFGPVGLQSITWIRVIYCHSSLTRILSKLNGCVFMYKPSDCMLISVHLLKVGTFKVEIEEQKIPESPLSLPAMPPLFHIIYLSSLLSF